jgi:hypothetical protein
MNRLHSRHHHQETSVPGTRGDEPVILCRVSRTSALKLQSQFFYLAQDVLIWIHSLSFGDSSHIWPQEYR